MSNMNRVIHTKSDGEDKVDARDDINGDIPEVKKANNIDQSDDDDDENHETDRNISKKYQSDHEDTKHG